LGEIADFEKEVKDVHLNVSSLDGNPMGGTKKLPGYDKLE
jgi:hypothetical protein